MTQPANIMSIGLQGPQGVPGGAIGVGTYASRPVPGPAGQMYVTTDGPIAFVSDGTNWRPLIGGRLGTQTPAVASFATVYTAGAATTAQDSFGGILLSASNFSGTVMDYRIQKVTMPGGTFTYILHVVPQYTPNNLGLSFCGIVTRASSTGSVDAWGVYAGGPPNKNAAAAISALNRNWNTASDATGAPATFTNTDFTDYHLDIHTAGGVGLWLRFTYNPAGNKAFGYSLNGIHWKDVITVAFSDKITPTEIGFCVANIAPIGTLAGTDASMSAYFDSYFAG